MYRVFLKTKREPLIIKDDVNGAQLQDDWLNGELPDKVKIGDNAYNNDQIKGVEKVQVKREESLIQKGKEHWIIKKDDGNAMFGYPLATKEEALAVIQYNNLSGYHLEKK